MGNKILHLYKLSHTNAYSSILQLLKMGDRFILQLIGELQSIHGTEYFQL